MTSVSEEGKSAAAAAAAVAAAAVAAAAAGALEPPPKRSRRHHPHTTTAVAAAATTTTTATTLAAAAPYPVSFLVSPPDSIRSRIFTLHSFDADWREIFAVSDAMAAQRKWIERCERVLAYLSSEDEGIEPAIIHDGLKSYPETLRREVDDWT